MTSIGEFPAGDIDEAARFAIRVRSLIHNPESWRKIMATSNHLMDMAGAKFGMSVCGDQEIEEVTLLAIALMMARRCARSLPALDPTRIECETMIDKLVSLTA